MLNREALTEPPMNSPAGPVTTTPVLERARRAILVALVWVLSALPFVLGAVECPTARVLHAPCPGCGMTRAFHLLEEGRIAASLALHPLAVPTAAVQAALALATVAATLRFGAPWSLLRARWGRVAVALASAVLLADVLLWIARALGALGGPVSV